MCLCNVASPLFMSMQCWISNHVSMQCASPIMSVCSVASPIMSMQGCISTI
jgi:hypothetical protein